RNVKPETQNKRVALEGAAFWLKARALRDYDFAAALVDGKPIKVTIDSTTGQSFRAIVSIRDVEREAEAKICLIQAALRLKDNADVQTDTLRMVVMHTPTNVALLERICLQMLAIDPLDTRANYQLANYHYEQPAQDAKGGQGPPLPL